VLRFRRVLKDTSYTYVNQSTKYTSVMTGVLFRRWCKQEKGFLDTACGWICICEVSGVHRMASDDHYQQAPSFGTH